MSSDTPITAQEWDLGSCHRELQKNVSSLLSNFWRKKKGDFKEKLEKEWKANRKTTLQLCSYGPTVPWVLCTILVLLFQKCMVRQRKIWRRELWLISLLWQCLHQERWNRVIFFPLEKRGPTCGGRGIFEVLERCRKGTKGNWVLSVSSCTGIKGWCYLHIFTCVQETCKAPHWTVLCVLEASREDWGSTWKRFVLWVREKLHQV